MMATAERPAQVEAPKPQLVPGESLIEINPYLIELPLRAELPATGRKSSKPPSGSCGAAVPADLLQAAKELYAKKLTPAASSFCTALSRARQAAISALHSTSASEAGVTEAVSAYLALLQGLSGPLTTASPGAGGSDGGEVPRPSSSSAAAGEEAPMQTADPFIRNMSSPGGGALDSALEFRHWDGFRAAAEAPGPRAGGAAYEAAQTLLSLALWKAAAAARAANRPSGDAVSSAQCAEAYRLMREAAGIADELQKQSFQGAASRSGASDLQPALLAALSSCWLGDAESLTVARAIAKGSSHSVVAAVASDCAGLYEAAGRCPGDSDLHAKIRAYTALKGAAMDGYAHISNAQKLIDQDLAAEALRSSAEAMDALRLSQEAKAAFLKAPPRDISAAGHEAFERHVKNTVERAADRITRINSAVHYKAPASDLPALPPPSRLAAAIPPVFAPRAPDALGLAEAIEGTLGSGDGVPDPALAQGGGTGGSKPAGPSDAMDDHQQPDEEVGCCCGALRWLLVLLAMPILLMASLVGVVVWIVLLPFKLPCCCCVGCLAQIVWDVVEWLVKAPAKGLLYASGKPWKPDESKRPRGGGGSDAVAANV